jgi:hypothetical protein
MVPLSERLAPVEVVLIISALLIIIKELDY